MKFVVCLIESNNKRLYRSFYGHRSFIVYGDLRQRDALSKWAVLSNINLYSVEGDNLLSLFSGKT